MSEITILPPPILIPKIKIDPEVKLHLLTQTEEEAQVIVHCVFHGNHETNLIRIWQSTFLYAHGSMHKSRLVHHENITLFPIWTAVDVNETKNFTLIFSALPKSCMTFDFIEKIPESGGFQVLNIPRNKSDVYSIELG